MDKTSLMTNQFRIKRSDGTFSGDHVIEYQERMTTNVGMVEGSKYYVRDSDQAPLKQISETEYVVETTGERIHV